MDTMLVTEFKNQIKIANVRPKFVKIGYELWQALKKMDLIKMKPVAAWGVYYLNFNMPFFDEDICLLYEPDELQLEGKKFLLPPSCTA